MPDDRWFTAGEAAGYLRLSSEGFRRKVRDGVIPPPSYALGASSPRWDRLALDARMMGGVASTDPNEAADAIAAEIVSRRPHRPQATR